MEMSLMKDDACVFSMMRQKLDESVKKPFKNRSKWKTIKIAQNLAHWSFLKACSGV